MRLKLIRDLAAFITLQLFFHGVFADHDEPQDQNVDFDGGLRRVQEEPEQEQCNNKLNRKSCTAIQNQYCSQTYCPQTCEDNLELTGSDLRRCLSSCKPCCNAVKTGSYSGSKTWYFSNCDDPFTKQYPQCKKFVGEWGEETSLGDLEKVPPRPAGSHKIICGDPCDEECINLCEAYASSSNKKDCENKCKPCCRVALENQCRDNKSGLANREYVDVDPRCSRLECDYPNVYADLLCFPADATVINKDGKVLRMDELQIGDKVAVMQNGAVTYEEIYLFGHQDSKVFGFNYVKIFVSTGEEDFSLTLARTHYIPMKKDSTEVLVTAKDILTGSIVSVWDGNKIVDATVKGKTRVAAYGAYNPFTMKGNIIVNGVVASSHNDWALAEKFIPEAIKSKMPILYESLLAVHRLGYKILGASSWKRLNSHIDFSAPKVRKAVGMMAVYTASFWDDEATRGVGSKFTME